MADGTIENAIDVCFELPDLGASELMNRFKGVNVYYEVYKSPTNIWGGEEALEVKVPGTMAIVQGNAPVDAQADTADATSITDMDIAGYGTDYFVGDVIVQTRGTYKGQEAIVTAYNNSTGQVSVQEFP